MKTVRPSLAKLVPHVTDAAFVAAFEARLLPVLQVDGYRRLSQLHYGRIDEDVFQLLVVQAPPSGKHFYLEHAALLLVEPHAFVNFDVGARFPETGGYCLFDDVTSSGDSERLLVDYLTVLRPRLQMRANLVHFLDLVLRQLGESGSPHLWFTLAVGHARLGQEKAARRYAQEALTRYRTLGEPPLGGVANVNANWARKGEQRAELLVDALYSGRVAALLDGWRSGTVAALGLENLQR